MLPYVICALYKFVRLENYLELRQPLMAEMEAAGVRGTLLLAQEGINGTIAGTREGIDRVLAWLRQDPRLADLDTKESLDETLPFYRTKVKLKKEIVTMGVDGIDPLQVVGTYVKPSEWNALISRDDVLLIDTRNDYEVKIGQFKGAINPKTDTFREFPDYVREQLDPQRHKQVAMYCTGGIRCEKSTALLKEMGFEGVYHLQGGILKYLEDVPEEDSLWEGECFVFDNRVTVNHQLEKGRFDQCHACRMPISDEDKASPLYEAGVSCPHCHDRTSQEQRARFSSRQQQIDLAKKRGEAHLGADAVEVIRRRQAEKRLERKAYKGGIAGDSEAC